jgi:hypothetical protein
MKDEENMSRATTTTTVDSMPTNWKNAKVKMGVVEWRS